MGNNINLASKTINPAETQPGGKSCILQIFVLIPEYSGEFPLAGISKHMKGHTSTLNDSPRGKHFQTELKKKGRDVGRGFGLPLCLRSLSERRTFVVCVCRSFTAEGLFSASAAHIRGSSGWMSVLRWV